MISLIQQIPAGNALRLYITPPRGVSSWRVLRRTTDTITGPDDPGAVLVMDGRDESVLDTEGLVNGVTYFYQPFYRIAPASWLVGEGASGTPLATYQGDTIDAQTLLRDRLALGLAVEVKRGALKPQSGKVQVLTAPFALLDGVTFPCVSVHLEVDGSSQRGLGEMLAVERHESGRWIETEGWLSRVVLNVVGTSLNGDERIALRQAIARIITANLPIFDDAGLMQVDLSQRDAEDQAEKGAILYLTVGSFTCTAPSFVTSSVGEISGVTAAPLPYSPGDAEHG